MGFEIRTREATAGGTAGTVYELIDTGGAARAEIWPAFGFNCLRWQLPRTDGALGDLIYCDPDWERNPIPTRSGHPILFPFPNRMRAGRFAFEGRDYQLPKNEAGGANAIHGFTPKTPWRVIGQTACADSASVTGEFRLSVDRPDLLAYWPADFAIEVEYTLSFQKLRLDCRIANLGAGRLPFGLGFHPYFACPNAPDARADDMVLSCATEELWVTEAGLTTVVKLPVPEALDFRTVKAIGDLSLDTLYSMEPHGGKPFATLGHRTAPGRLSVFADESFREGLLFTPPHRRAVAIEPYTCATDAPNLTARGIDSGWRTLEPGGRFTASLHYEWDPNRPGMAG